MDRRLRVGLLIAALAGAAAPVSAAAQSRDSLPPGVTPKLVTQGKALFAGKALCAACHGPDGAGALAPSLIDTTWLHSKGSYLEIVAQIKSGVEGKDSKSGVVMPPMGGARLSEDEVKAVAAYVWRISRPHTE